MLPTPQESSYDCCNAVALAFYADVAYNQLNFEEKERAQGIFIVHVLVYSRQNLMPLCQGSWRLPSQ
jgi:hypothetical protein